MIECVQLPSDVSQRVVVVSLDGLGALLPELAHLCLEARISVLALARPQYTLNQYVVCGPVEDYPRDLAEFESRFATEEAWLQLSTSCPRSLALKLSTR